MTPDRLLELRELLEAVPPWSMAKKRSEALPHEVARKAVPPGRAAMLVGDPERFPGFVMSLIARVDQKGVLQRLGTMQLRRMAAVPLPDGVADAERRRTRSIIAARMVMLRNTREVNDPIPISSGLAELLAPTKPGEEERVDERRESPLADTLRVLDVVLSAEDQRRAGEAMVREELLRLIDEIGDSLPGLPESAPVWRALCDDPFLELRTVKAALRTLPSAPRASHLTPIQFAYSRVLVAAGGEKLGFQDMFLRAQRKSPTLFGGPSPNRHHQAQIRSLVGRTIEGHTVLGTSGRGHPCMFWTDPEA